MVPCPPYRGTRFFHFYCNLAHPYGVILRPCKMRKTIIGLWLFWLLSSFLFAGEKRVFYLSPEGSDENPGTEEAPFLTLEKARHAVREARKDTHPTEIIVYLRGGRYEISQTEVFTLEDSGSQTLAVTYAAYPGETPLLSGGKEVMKWEKPAEAIPGLPEKAVGKVLVAEVDSGFKVLFDAEGILPRARSERFIVGEHGGRDRVPIPASHMKDWSNPAGMDVHVRPHHAWVLNILPVTALNFKQRTLYTSIDSSYVIRPLHFLKDVPNCWVENAIEELDEEGEWVLDQKAGKLYLWPRNDTPVYYPQVEEIIRLEGGIDLNGSTDTPLKNIHFRGLTFLHGDRYEIGKKETGLQHDWDIFDKGNALLRFRGTEQCSIKWCHFLHSGSGAIRVDLHGVKNEISENRINHIGGGGILLSGYGPGKKDVNRENRVYNNHIHHVGEIYWHSPGIMLWQSGKNKVQNNLIHHTGYTAIIISGFMEDFFRRGGRELVRTVRWHEVGSKKEAPRSWEESLPYLHTRDNLIEGNEIHHVMEKMGDGNGIYIRGAGAGNIIRRNYLHHLITPMIMQAAIRTDGGQRGTLITENIIYKCMSQGALIKLDNHFNNNIIADVISPPRGYYLSLREGPMTGAEIQRNIFYSSGDFPVEDFINELPGKFKGKTEDRRGRALARAIDTEMDYNLYYAERNPERAAETLKKHQEGGVEINSAIGDPMFKDLATGDFSLHPDSPALKLGFRQIQMENIGLQGEMKK